MSLQGEEKQEFSFTLYDFNGHGKVTKDVSTGERSLSQMREILFKKLAFTVKISMFSLLNQQLPFLGILWIKLTFFKSNFDDAIGSCAF